jgi:hypothetical protein
MFTYDKGAVTKQTTKRLSWTREEAMKHSTDRIITTHVGSLPRPERLEELLIQRDHGKNVDQAEFDKEVESALDYVLEKQIESGVDVGNDGEEPRVGFQTYVPQRMSGFSGVSQRKMLTDMVRFPKYAKMFTERTWSPDRTVAHAQTLDNDCASASRRFSDRYVMPFLEVLFISMCAIRFRNLNRSMACLSVNEK